ncbi:envelope stress sensor histidine kinase CpxA [Aliivibrio kagoshimensis]|uniref:envelope stress sensor histidine kinase CpxA n=1 Tax=Aliivibrio kagoshimensis TaxID=2910230 RepID=UPI003D10E5BB
MLNNRVRFSPFSSLYGRIFAIFWLTLFLVLLAVVIAPHFDPRSQHEIGQAPLVKIQKVAESITHKYQHNADFNRSLSMIDQYSNKQPGSFSLFFTNYSGEIVNEHHRGQSKSLRNFITLSDDLNNPKQKLYGRKMLAGPFKVTIANQKVLLYVSRFYRNPPPFILQILDRPAQLLVAAMLVSTPFLLWLAWALSQPARRLQHAAERVARGQFVHDPSLEKGTKEFRKTGASFNQMVGAINTMVSGQQRLLSDISHELRSPLTRLRMATALASRKQGESAELDRIEMEAERLEKMIAELLELSRMQINSHEDRVETDTKTLWFDILEDAKFEAEQSGKNLHYDAIEAWPISGNPNLLMSALENVVRNAIRYGEKQIRISINKQAGRLTLIVEDDGSGVPDDELNDIFRPFYRVSTARDRVSGGTGLGLAITENAIRQHNGTITASSSKMGGLKMTLNLPLQ